MAGRNKSRVDQGEEHDDEGRTDRRNGNGNGDPHSRRGLGKAMLLASAVGVGSGNGVHPRPVNGNIRAEQQVDPYSIPTNLGRVGLTSQICSGIREGGLLPGYRSTLDWVKTLVVPHLSSADRRYFEEFFTEERLVQLVRDEQWEHKLWSERETGDAKVALAFIGYGVYSGQRRSAGRALTVELAKANGLSQEEAYRLSTTLLHFGSFLDFKTVSKIEEVGLFNSDDPRVRAAWEFLRLYSRGIPPLMLRNLLGPITDEQVLRATAVREERYMRGMVSHEEKLGAWAAVRLIAWFLESYKVNNFFNQVLKRALQAQDAAFKAEEELRLVVYSTGDDGGGKFNPFEGMNFEAKEPVRHIPKPSGNGAEARVQVEDPLEADKAGRRDGREDPIIKAACQVDHVKFIGVVRDGAMLCINCLSELDVDELAGIDGGLPALEGDALVPATDTSATCDECGMVLAEAAAMTEDVKTEVCRELTATYV